MGGIGEVNDFYGLGDRTTDEQAAAAGIWDIGNLWGETRVLATLLGPLCVPFARDGGDNQLYLDLSYASPAVSRFVSATHRKYQLAPSIEEFLSALRAPTAS
jgi:hypothetical protein